MCFLLGFKIIHFQFSTLTVQKLQLVYLYRIYAWNFKASCILMQNINYTEVWMYTIIRTATHTGLAKQRKERSFVYERKLLIYI